MRTLYWYLYFAISITLLTPKLKRLQLKKGTMSKEEYETTVNEIVSKWALKQIKNSGATIHVKGHENIPEGPVLFISNHQSSFDIAILLSYVKKNKGFIAKEDMNKIPLLKTWMKELRCLFIDRNDMRKSLQTIREGIKILKDDYSMVIFPEGTRSLDGKLNEFKAGSFKLATKTGVPIVPVTIDGSYKILKSGSIKINPATVYVTIHPFVEIKNLEKDKLIEIPNKIKNIIQSSFK